MHGTNDTFIAGNAITDGVSYENDRIQCCAEPSSGYAYSRKPFSHFSIGGSTTGQRHRPRST